MDDLLHKRNYSLDIARIVAVFAVVMIHCSALFVSEYQPFSGEFIFGNLFDSISRIGVPLFLMISGALFLDESKKITLKSILVKNVKSLAIITIIWAIIYSVVYNVVVPLLTDQPISVKVILLGIIDGHYHMWYLYMIIGLYIITPFLKKIVCKENSGMVLFFIIISLVAHFFTPIINIMCKLGLNCDFINTWLDKFYLDFFSGYVTYFLTGWYIIHIGIKSKLSRFIIYFLGILSLAFIFFYVHFTGGYEDIYWDISFPVYIYSVSVFLALNNIKLNLSEKTAKILTNLSKLTFGVYIIHVIILSIVNKLFAYSTHPGLYIVICFAIVVCLSFLATYIMSKIPLIKKFIRA